MKKPQCSRTFSHFAQVTDVFGKALDFSAGRTLIHNVGVIATTGAIHDEVITVRVMRRYHSDADCILQAVGKALSKA